MSRQATLWVVVLALVLFAGNQALGQDSVAETTDLEGWTSAELKFKVNKQWMFSVEEQLRMQNDVSEVDKHFTQLGFRYKTPRDLSFSGGYRWIRQNDTQGKIQGYESERRYQLAASYGHKLGRFSLGYRVQYQNKEEVGSEDPDNAVRHFRFRTRVRYNVRDWSLDPVFAAELYRSVGDDTESEFDKIRLTLGTDWGTWDGGEMGVFYRLEKELGVDSPQTTHILGLKFAHTLEWD